MLTESDSLEMNMEWHMNFERRITVNWRADVTEDDDEEITAKALHQPVKSKQIFTIRFTCVVEENLYFLCPPSKIEDPCALIGDLIQDGEESSLLSILELHGWDAEGDSTPGGQGYWEIQRVNPELDDWHFEADLLGDGSGSLFITDPSEQEHMRRIQAPYDYDDEYINPTLGQDLTGLEMIQEVLDSSCPLEQLEHTLSTALSLGK